MTRSVTLLRPYLEQTGFFAGPARELELRVQLNDILITAELVKRSYREPNWKAQSIAFSTLARIMANNPERLVDALLKMALQLCGAETSGLSAGDDAKTAATLPVDERSGHFKVPRWRHDSKKL